MIANLVKVRVKPEKTARFLEAIEHDALHSEQDERGCLRFNVIRDRTDPNVYIFYEVYEDEAALDEHRKTPHFGVWSEAAKECLDGPAERTGCEVLFPKELSYWKKG